jgi:hypothetical protein
LVSRQALNGRWASLIRKGHEISGGSISPGFFKKLASISFRVTSGQLIQTTVKGWKPLAVKALKAAPLASVNRTRMPFVVVISIAHTIFTADSQDIMVSGVPGHFDWLLKHSNAEVRARGMAMVSTLARDSLSLNFLAWYLVY